VHHLISLGGGALEFGSGKVVFLAVEGQVFFSPKGQSFSIFHFLWFPFSLESVGEGFFYLDRIVCR
jgi:hypothetical protein